jgi:hypothetical protein
MGKRPSLEGRSLAEEFYRVLAEQRLHAAQARRRDALVADGKAGVVVLTEL